MYLLQRQIYNISHNVNENVEEAEVKAGDGMDSRSGKEKSNIDMII